MTSTSESSTHSPVETVAVVAHGRVDVREAVEDWPKMHEKAVSIAESLDADELPVGESEVEEARELLEWLADEHFTFLGFREYKLERQGDDELLRAIPGTA